MLRATRRVLSAIFFLLQLRLPLWLCCWKNKILERKGVEVERRRKGKERRGKERKGVEWRRRRLSTIGFCLTNDLTSSHLDKSIQSYLLLDIFRDLVLAKKLPLYNRIEGVPQKKERKKIWKLPFKFFYRELIGPFFTRRQIFGKIGFLKKINTSVLSLFWCLMKPSRLERDTSR